MTALLRCFFCARRVRPIDAVYFRNEPAHPDCADEHWARLADVTEHGGTT